MPFCAGAATCAACLASPACGWCASTATCGLGLPTQQSYAACPVATSPGATDGAPLPWGPAGTPVDLYFNALAPLPARATCAAECAALSDCEACTHRADCGWCEAELTCARSADLARGAACGNASGTWLNSDAQCPALRCSAFADVSSCVGDPYCGYCDQGPWPASISNFCGPGDAFGFVGAAFAGRCTRAASRYLFRSTTTTCAFGPRVAYPSCATCRAQGGGGGVCGWCSSRLACGLAAGADDPDGPALGVCPPGNASAGGVGGTWFGAPQDGVCPSLPVTPRQLCAARSTSCSTCLTAASSLGCSFCDGAAAGLMSTCMLLGDAVGLAPALAGTFDAAAAAACPAASTLRGLASANYSFGNATTLSLPGTAGVGCAVSCSSAGSTVTASSGVLQVGLCMRGREAAAPW